MDLREQIRAQLTGAGSPFEIVEEDVRGERMQVFKQRLPSLRQLLIDSGQRGDAEVLVQGDWRISYAEHLRLVGSVAHALRDRYGIRKGDRVAILAANSAEWVISYWATISLGGIVASLNGWWTPDEIAYGISDSQPSLLIGDRRRLERVSGLNLDVPLLEIESGFRELLEHAPDAGLPAAEIHEDDPAVILYTSGTTGRPKGAVNSHRGILGFIQTNMLSGAEGMLYEAQVYPEREKREMPAQQVTLATSPMFHLSGLYGTIVMGFSMGGKMVVRSGRFDPEDVLRLMEKERVTSWGALGSMGPRVVSHPSIEKYDLSSVVNVGFGGAPVSPTTQEAIRKAFPNAAANLAIGYGSSETVSVVAGIRGEEYRKYPESTGRVNPTVQCEIRDENGNPVPDGVDGEIHVRSAYNLLEYWGNPEATAQAFKPGRWLATGDIGRFEDGLLYINSRARDMILVNAENVYPIEIEHRLDSHPSVRESAVVGVDDSETGQAIKAIVVIEPGTQPQEAELAAWVGETLAGYKVPAHWALRDEPLPRNPSGKVLKNVLTGEAESTFVAED